jgi:hypothetical protein
MSSMLDIELSKVFFILLRAIPIIILSGITLWLLFTFRSNIDFGIDERYLFDISKNLMSSQLTGERSVFNVKELETNNRLKIQTYVESDDYSYEVIIARGCGELKDRCHNYCTDVCKAESNSYCTDKPEIPQRMSYCMCGCREGDEERVTGIWVFGDKDFDYEQKFIGDIKNTDYFPVSVKTENGKIYPATLSVSIEPR